MGKSKQAKQPLQEQPQPNEKNSSLTVVLPGDDVTSRILANAPSNNNNSKSNKPPKLGTGLRFDPTAQRIKVTCAGRLTQHRNNRTWFVQQNTQRYAPRVEDRVVGIIEDRIGSDGLGGDLFRVNIGGPHPALLSNLSFEGATKRNKPPLQSGMLLYARVSQMPNYMDPVLSCQLGPNDVGLVRKDWMTNEGTYGELKGGNVQRIALGLARELLRPQNLVLEELASPSNGKLAFEVAVGVNGYVWVHSPRPEYTILIQNAIQNSQVLTEAQCRGMVKSLVYTVQKQLQQDADGEIS